MSIQEIIGHNGSHCATNMRYSMPTHGTNNAEACSTTARLLCLQECRHDLAATACRQAPFHAGAVKLRAGEAAPILTIGKLLANPPGPPHAL